MKTKRTKTAKPVYYPDFADTLRRHSYASANGGRFKSAAFFARLADKEDAKEPEAWRYAGAGKLGVEGI